MKLNQYLSLHYAAGSWTATVLIMSWLVPCVYSIYIAFVVSNLRKVPCASGIHAGRIARVQKHFSYLRDLADDLTFSHSTTIAHHGAVPGKEAGLGLLQKCSDHPRPHQTESVRRERARKVCDPPADPIVALTASSLPKRMIFVHVLTEIRIDKPSATSSATPPFHSALEHRRNYS